ncbi:HTH domain-containing protein [Pontibaca methylaminivorans]|uniref:HTH domain-containing protein n=2 Tax=Pontibaca methylaminivorans TaxID=515897 RepID=A0A1R3WE79_9RHOB|nr:HTH domain-containing protein [Pontibaca methylaminivorans]
MFLTVCLDPDPETCQNGAMSQSQRLFDLLRILRGGGLHRAEDLAHHLGVSQRTLYRYIDRLAEAGVPVEGKRGVGYRLREEILIPPLSLAPDEFEALQLGIAIVAESPDPGLRGAALALAGRLDAALPAEPLPQEAAWTAEFAPRLGIARGLSQMPLIRNAIRGRQKLRLGLAGGTLTVRPLRLDHVGRIWMLTVWSEEDGAFRDLRLDLIEAVTALPGLFVDEPGKRLRDRP